MSILSKLLKTRFLTNFTLYIVDYWSIREIDIAQNLHSSIWDLLLNRA
jgi:hypothetical protein